MKRCFDWNLYPDLYAGQSKWNYFKQSPLVSRHGQTSDRQSTIKGSEMSEKKQKADSTVINHSWTKYLGLTVVVSGAPGILWHSRANFFGCFQEFQHHNSCSSETHPVVAWVPWPWDPQRSGFSWLFHVSDCGINLFNKLGFAVSARMCERKRLNVTWLHVILNDLGGISTHRYGSATELCKLCH